MSMFLAGFTESRFFPYVYFYSVLFSRERHIWSRNQRNLGSSYRVISSFMPSYR